MRHAMAVLLSTVSAAAQNFSVAAVSDGISDLQVRLARISELELRVIFPDSPMAVVEISAGPTMVWSWIIQPYQGRDGFIERPSNQHPAELRIPVRLIPPGTWHLRVLTIHGPSDTIELRTYP